MASRDTRTPGNRAFARATHRTRAVVSTGRGEYAANAVDISIAGVRLEISGPVNCTEFVRVRLPLSSEQGAPWIDADALVVRSVPGQTRGSREIGLSFLELPATTLRQLSACVSRSLAEAAASNKPPSPTESTAPPAEPGGAGPAPRKQGAPVAAAPQFPTENVSDSGPSTARHRTPPLPHPAPLRHDSEPAPANRWSASNVAPTLVRLFGRRKRAKAASRPQSAATPANTQVSAAELRDLFRSAVASVDGEERKTRKR